MPSDEAAMIPPMPQIAVSHTVATLLEDEQGLMAGRTVHVCNRDATISVFLGGSDVTSGNGYELKAGEKVGPLPMPEGAAKLYAIAASGTPRVDVLAV